MQTLFVVPFEDEALSSWLMRLAINSNSHATEYYSSICKINGIWYRDIDRSTPIGFYECLSHRLPYSITEIQELSLSSLNGYLYEFDNPNGINKWIRQLSFIGRKPKNSHFAYCPSCLSEPNGYFKKLWRTRIINICSKCGCYLRDTCPNCFFPIHFFRKSNLLKNEISVNLIKCFNCNKNICDIKYEYAPQRLIDSTRKIEKIIKSGHHIDFNYSFLYFDTLYQVYKTLVLHFGILPPFNFETQSKLINISMWLLDEFPNNIVLISKNRKISKSVWLKDFYQNRFHFNNEITHHLSKLKLTQFD